MTEKPSQRMAADLRDAIANGYYSPGQQLPSVSTLMERYGLARQTVQNVVAQLRAEGLVIGRSGAGLFVRERPPVQQSTRRHATDEDRQHGYVVERITSRPAQQADAETLNTTAGQPVIVVTSATYDANGHQLAENEVTLPADQYELVYELPAGGGD